MTGGLLISLRTEDNQCVISDESRPFVIGTHFILMAAVDDGLSEQLGGQEGVQHHDGGPHHDGKDPVYLLCIKFVP